MEKAFAAGNYETEVQHDLGSKIQVSGGTPEAIEICKAGATPGNLGDNKQSRRLGEPPGKQE
eukprot:5951387-Karenia_brevis.AAC.1